MATHGRATFPKLHMAKITGKSWNEGKLWLAEMDELPIASFGNTPNEVMSRLMVTLQAYIESCFKDKELGIVMKHYDLMVQQQAAEYTFCFETPVGERGSDLVRA